MSGIGGVDRSSNAGGDGDAKAGADPASYTRAEQASGGADIASSGKGAKARQGGGPTDAAAMQAALDDRYGVHPANIDALMVRNHTVLADSFQLAQATTATVGDVPVPTDRTSGVPLDQLTGRVLRIGGGLFTGAAILKGIDDARERSAVDGALGKFDLDASSATDVFAARAYVWGKNMAPLTFANVPFSGEKNERAAEGLMRLERAAPGTLGAGMQGDAGARAMVETTIAAALDGEALERTSSVDPALSTGSTRARGIAAATAGGMLTQRWQAHHLVPFESVASLPPALQTKMAAAGWKMDSAENLIALPADPATFQGPPNNGALPMHNGSHPRYSSFVNGQLGNLRANHQSMNPAQIRVELDRIETHMQAELLNKVYHSRVH